MKYRVTMLVATFAGFVNLATCAHSAIGNDFLDTISSATFGPTTGAKTNETHVSEETPQAEGHLERRANWDMSPMATDDLWCKAQAKGASMYAIFWKSDVAAGRLYNPPRQSANSMFRANNFNTMLYETWGWSDADNKFNDAVFNDFYGAGWIRAMQERSIGIIPWQDIWSYHYTHGAANLKDEKGQPFPINEQTYVAYNKRYRATGARAKFGVQDKAGAIMVSVAVSPAESFKAVYGREAGTGELPMLRSLSDLLFAGWLRGSNPHAGNPNPANLNYMFMMWIVNRETLSIMKRALRARGKDKYSVWPGDDFSTATEEGQALLGSPNGKPMGYLVNQRKLDIGVK
ncbi:Mitochondrial import inner membrane translocase subunit tim8 [Didymosphaeria variabile]|uniref:Mitochondrial import inner membrane translocase subunit tim8 n=1 Tax=Didymosphaeria variabile TaxID=1932322 RepID=A0A9W9C7A7_9PLEO|nr:Mitochondrial import inner membrane translocase subunit tim8 [Didymosphaeria variabile]KAJ4346672.1 Mitochondrial import inner membrane translocase subunit tim8 [Didymosphaeria variabile]